MNTKGQALTWDFVFSSMMFLVMVLVLIFLWDNALVEMVNAEEDYEMSWLAQTVAKTLVNTPGTPMEWNSSDVVLYGLAKTTNRGGVTYTMTQVIDPNKLMRFINDASANYTKTRAILLSTSKYDYYLELTCLNESSVECFQGLTLNLPAISPIKCANLYSFTISSDMMGSAKTDSYKWIEAEGLWGNMDAAQCTPANGLCSNSQSSLVRAAGARDIETNPGTYDAWVRCLPNGAGLRLVVNGIRSSEVCKGAGPFKWFNAGQFRLDYNTNMEFSTPGATSNVDAVLLTNNGAYDPELRNVQYFGNPTTIKECRIGNIPINPKKAIVGLKTASFNEPLNDLQLLSGSQPYLPRTVKLRVVIWKGG